jgi:hypothetical protein
MTAAFSMLNGLEVGMIGLFLSVGLAFTVFWIWALVDCARRISDGERNLIGWLITICLTHAIGAFCYVVFARRSSRTV